MSVHKNKNNNTWYVKYQNKTKRGFKTKFEAQQFEAKLRLDKECNVLLVSIYNVADDYLDYCYHNLTYGSYKKLDIVLHNIILPNIVNKPINQINELECRKFSDFVFNLDYSTKYKNFIIGTYKALFNHAIEFYKLPYNPSNVIKRFKKTFDEKMQDKEKELNIWTVDEFNEFILYVDKEMYKQLFVVIYFTGLRLGEALALTWNDFRDSKLFINKSMTRKTNKGTYEIKEPKNVSSIRNIALGDNLNKYLQSFKECEMKLSGFSNNWFIFGRISPLPQTSIYRVQDKAIKLSNVRKIRIHDLRHSHASNLIANGVNIVAVSRRLGHSDINMTLSVYTHLLKKNEDELTRYLDKSSQNLLNK